MFEEVALVAASRSRPVDKPQLDLLAAVVGEGRRFRHRRRGAIARAGRDRHGLLLAIDRERDRHLVLGEQEREGA